MTNGIRATLIAVLVCEGGMECETALFLFGFMWVFSA